MTYSSTIIISEQRNGDAIGIMIFIVDVLVVIESALNSERINQIVQFCGGSDESDNDGDSTLSI